MVEEGKGSDLPSKGEDPYNETSYLTIILPSWIQTEDYTWCPNYIHKFLGNFKSDEKTIKVMKSKENLRICHWLKETKGT